MTREEVALALGEPVPQLAKSMQLKQFADPRNEAKVGQGPDYGDDDDDDDEEEEEQGNNDLGDGWEIVKEKRAAATVPPAPPPPAAPAAAADDELELGAHDGAELASGAAASSAVVSAAHIACQRFACRPGKLCTRHDAISLGTSSSRTTRAPSGLAWGLSMRATSLLRPMPTEALRPTEARRATRMRSASS